MLLFALAVLPASTPLAHADDDDDDDDADHYRAGRAVTQGQARPLAQILAAIQAQLGGEVVGVKFKRKNGRYVYKLKVVTPAGGLREVSVDAATGDIVQNEDD